jgi:hypothetical protein
MNRESLNNKSGMGLSQALKVLLANEEMADVTIVASLDGTRVGANRCILASRSDVLHSMLYGNFLEATSDEVSFNCSGANLRMVAEYCYTDHIDSLDIITERLCQHENRLESELEGDRIDDIQDCRLLSSLAMTSDFLHLPYLGVIVFECIQKISAAVPKFACVFLDGTIACCGDAEDGPLGDEQTAGQKTFQHSLSVIRENPVLSLWGYETKTNSRTVADLLRNGKTSEEKCDTSTSPPGILALGPASLKKVMTDKNMCTTEVTIFCALKTWADGTPFPLINADAGFLDLHTEDAIFHEGSTEKSRVQIAKSMTKYIQFEKIKPHHLNEIVAPSGLLTMEQLVGGYRLHALLAERRGFSHATSRSALWDDGSSFDKSSIHVMTGPDALPATVRVPESQRNKYRNVFLQCDDMVPGTVHKWKFKVNTGSPQYDEIWVGIVNTTVWSSDRCGGFLNFGDNNVKGSNNSPGRGVFFGDKYFAYLYAPSLGQTVNRGQRTAQRYPIHIGEGIMISFTLDLREGTRNGSLIAKVDNRPTRVLFDNLLLNRNAFAGKTPSFVPAAVMMNHGEIEFLGFESIGTDDKN